MTSTAFRPLAAAVFALATAIAWHVPYLSSAADGDSDDEQAAQENNPWKINPFQKTKYIQPYPPSKFGYSVQAGKMVYRSTYDYETKHNDKIDNKQAGEDIHVNFIFRNSSRGAMPTGGRHGVGSLRAQLDDLGKDARTNREPINRIRAIIKILEKDQQTVNLFDGFRYRLRRPTRYYGLNGGESVELTDRLTQTASMGHLHGMQEFQIDESGLLSEHGARVVARDDLEDLTRNAGNIFVWWSRAFGHWSDFEEFPMLPPDIDYIRARHHFIVQNMQADWEVSYKEAKRQRNVGPVDEFCKRWYNASIQQVFAGLNDYSWRNIKNIVKFMDKNIGKADNEYRSWLRGEWKDKYLAEEDLYANRPGAVHKESEAIALIAPGVLAYQHNECEFVGRDKITVAGLDGKDIVYDCLHFRRKISVENLKLPMVEIIVDKCQEDIWYVPRLRVTAKRDYDLDFKVSFMQQVLDPKNPKAPPTVNTNSHSCRYRITTELVQRDTAQKNFKLPELNAFKSIVNAYNTAIGAEYQNVKERLDAFQEQYVRGPRESDFAQAIDTLSKQCDNMAEVFSQGRGFRRHPEIHPDEFFCTYVPEDFNPAERYGLILFLADEGDDVEARVKEWGQMLIGKGFIAVGFRPQNGKYNHGFNQSADHLYTIIRSLGSVYNIDPARRYMVGTGKGAQMVMTMAAFSFSDFDRFALYMPVSGGYLPFDDDCRNMINSPQGQGCQQALLSNSYLFIYPGKPNMRQTGKAPDAAMALAVAFANVRANNKDFDNHLAGIAKPEHQQYSQELARVILNEIIPKFETGKQAFFKELDGGVIKVQAVPAATKK